MKALIIYGSPRYKNSASYHLGENFVKGMQRGGAEVVEIMLCKQKINHCIGCYTCWTKTPGKCIHKDDMKNNLSILAQADLIVYAVPLYIYSVPGLVKDFLDRSLPLYEPYLTEENGVSSHPKRFPKIQKIFLISVAGFPEISHFDSLVNWFKKRYRREEYLGEILVGGSEPMSMDALQYRYKKLYNSMEQAGYEIVKNGNISEDTKMAIEKETFVPKENLESFREMANKYWDSFVPKNKSNDQLEIINDKSLELSDGGMATFLVGMAAQYNPNVLSGLKGVIQFNLDDNKYYLHINENICRAYQGSYPNPILIINSPNDIWMKISTGELNGAEAYLKKMYTVKGNMDILMKLNQLFSVSNDSKEISTAPQIPARKLEKFSETRGPLKIPEALWLNIAFVPWIVFWIWYSISPGFIPLFSVAIISLLITSYHLKTNRPTLFEKGSCIYLIIASLLFGMGIEFFITYLRMLNYIFLAGLWLISLTMTFSLTAEYSRLGFPKAIWSTQAFLKTNNIITGVWGIYFLYSAIISLVLIVYAEFWLLLMLIEYLSLIPMFIFTFWFQTWYPTKIVKSGVNNK